jgi:hypothetical protein
MTKKQIKKHKTGHDFRVHIPTTYKGQKKNAILEFYDDFFNEKDSKAIFEKLAKTEWDQMYERSNWSGIQKNSRLMKWYSEFPNAIYAFSSNSIGGVTVNTGEFTDGGLKPNPFTDILKSIRKKLMDLINAKREIEGKHPKPENYYNSVLVNYYQDGSDSVSWHADSDPWLGTDFSVPSLTFGAERPFHVRPNEFKDEITEFNLKDGSLLFMKGMTQEAFQHHVPSLPKRHEQYKNPRINLTFRRINPTLISKNPKGIGMKGFQKHILNWFRNTSLTEDDIYRILEAYSPHQIYRFILDLNNKRVKVAKKEKKPVKKKRKVE